MYCTEAQKNINSLIKKTLKGNELRKTYFHIKKCDECKEVLLDEFSFYVAFNDLDKDLDYNYTKELKKMLANTKDAIKISDLKIKIRYVILSILICLFLVFIVYIALRIVYI